jgi:hypothetical protein
MVKEIGRLTGEHPKIPAVRRYRVNPMSGSEYKTFTYFVPPHDAGGSLDQPWYLSFGQTSSDTLAYPTAKVAGVCGPSGVAVS